MCPRLFCSYPYTPIPEKFLFFGNGSNSKHSFFSYILEPPNQAQNTKKKHQNRNRLIINALQVTGLQKHFYKVVTSNPLIINYLYTKVTELQGYSNIYMTWENYFVNS